MERPLIGIALVVRKANQILLHKRKGKHATGAWACPGGHLEMWEDFLETALRELEEEAGDDLEVTEPKFLTVVNARFYEEHRHYVTIFMICDWISGKPQVTEPKKCARWEWFDYDNLPTPLMLGIQEIKDQGLLKSVLEGNANVIG